MGDDGTLCLCLRPPFAVRRLARPPPQDHRVWNHPNSLSRTLKRTLWPRSIRRTWLVKRGQVRAGTDRHASGRGGYVALSVAHDPRPTACAPGAPAVRPVIPSLLSHELHGPRTGGSLCHVRRRRIIRSTEGQAEAD
ncbi:hypothetical protein BS78_06G051400 [Paspalum vaginatum]|nr:hypothetical protein BS78_06G051400 [Paspalum vaginatum]KAJ1270427.1 hypothetical protein BS78_06G051400 [Paspalum vaginatum]KAJ1270428.1 hypothetical protein BS78_06G051400 [Paspalum vaginatum]